MTQRGRFKILIAPGAGRDLTALRDPVQQHIRDAIRRLADDPAPPESIAMAGEGRDFHRLHVGDYRVVYRFQEEKVTVFVVRIGHRGDVYRGLEGK